MAELPSRFQSAMQKLLGDEYDTFLSAFDDRRHFGLRVNTSKITKEEFERIAPFHLTPIPWIEDGYFYEEEDYPARHPFYAAGLYYLQEPSAMTPASRLTVCPGEKVLDLCAAPGGKATALGAKLQGEGLLVANDINTARARALLRNIELFGFPNSFVTNEPPHILAEKFPKYFDKIMVDAPCSGEGMFRKNSAVMDAWEEKGPEYFSNLQKEIILNAADMLKPGGRMFYSTCTFSPLENEATITYLLEQRPEIEVIPMEDYEGFSEGVLSFDGQIFHESCRMTRRIWPHKMDGEGHYLALLQKKGIPAEELQEPTLPATRKKAKKQKKGKIKNNSPKDKEQWNVVMEFLKEREIPITEQEVDIRGDKVYYVREKGFDTLGLHFIRNGVFLGDCKKKRFEPSEPFALALTKDQYNLCLEFEEDDERLRRYLFGESLSVDDLLEKRKIEGKTTENGWYLVLAEGYPLGFGKLAGNTLKNKYPTGWRRRE